MKIIRTQLNKVNIQDNVCLNYLYGCESEIITDQNTLAFVQHSCIWSLGEKQSAGDTDTHT